MRLRGSRVLCSKAGGLLGGLLGGSTSFTPPVMAEKLEEEVHGTGRSGSGRAQHEADNEFFWQAFKGAMASAGHRLGAHTKPTDVFDFRFNEDFTGKSNTGQQLVRGGEPYELPFGWKRYAVKVKGKYDGGDNTWLRQSGGPGEWAVAYHGTDHCNLPSILAGGLRAGSHQEHEWEVGRGVYVSPYMKDAADYSSVRRVPVPLLHLRAEQLSGGASIEQVTRLEHNGVMRNVRIVLQCRVRTSAIKKTSRTEYWVLNDPADIRPCESHNTLRATSHITSTALTVLEAL